jgi:RNA 2',3'-cyclic 3'-phosphodiesterase
MNDFNSVAMKRLFAAIKINPDKEFLDKIHSLEASLRYEKIKWVEDHNIHITLKFFGETEEKRIPGILSALRITASGTAPFSLYLKQLGIFGSSYDPRVIWIGIEPYKELVTLMKRIQEEIKPLGFEPDRQNLVPHLTLGRIKNLKDKALFQQTIDRYKTLSSGEFNASSFILFESILKKEGPTYKTLETFHLPIAAGKL